MDIPGVKIEKVKINKGGEFIIMVNLTSEHP